MQFCYSFQAKTVSSQQRNFTASEGTPIETVLDWSRNQINLYELFFISLVKESWDSSAALPPQVPV